MVFTVLYDRLNLGYAPTKCRTESKKIQEDEEELEKERTTNNPPALQDKKSLQNKQLVPAQFSNLRDSDMQHTVRSQLAFLPS